MKLRKTLLIANTFFAVLPNLAHAEVTDQPVVVNNLGKMNSTDSKLLKQLADPNSSFYKERGTFTVESARAQVILNAARGVGIRGGYAEEAQRINDSLMTKHRYKLNRSYNFAPLMLQSGHVVPPAITKINAVKELSGPTFLYLSQGSYEIVREARLATQAPTWMDWLILPIRDVRPPENLVMENSSEKAIWSKAVKDGWIIGIQEARSTFITSLATLNRDYNGMLMYQKLAKAGAVSVPQVDVAKLKWRVTDDGQRAYEGETALKIQVNSKFKQRR